MLTDLVTIKYNYYLESVIVCDHFFGVVDKGAGYILDLRSYPSHVKGLNTTAQVSDLSDLLLNRLVPCLG